MRKTTLLVGVLLSVFFVLGCTSNIDTVQKKGYSLYVTKGKVNEVTISSLKSEHISKMIDTIMFSVVKQNKGNVKSEVKSDKEIHLIHTIDDKPNDTIIIKSEVMKLIDIKSTKINVVKLFDEIEIPDVIKEKQLFIKQNWFHLIQNNPLHRGLFNVYRYNIFDNEKYFIIKSIIN